MILGVSPVAVHNERNVLRYWPLLESPDKQLMRLPEDPFGWRGAQKPAPKMCEVQVRHGKTVG